MITAVAYTTTNSIQTPAYSRQLDPTQRAEGLAVFRDEAVEAVHGLKAGTSLRVDNIPSELLKNGGEYTRTVLTAICQKILETKKWPKGVDTIARHPFTKERQPQAMSKLSYHQPSLPSCPAKPCSELFSSDSRPSVRKWRQKNE